MAPLSMYRMRDWSVPAVPITCAGTVLVDVVLFEGQQGLQALSLASIFEQACLLQLQAAHLFAQLLILLPDMAEVEIARPQAAQAGTRAMEKPFPAATSGRWPSSVSSRTEEASAAVGLGLRTCTANPMIWSTRTLTRNRMFL